MLVAGYLGFGALAAAHDIPLAVAVASTAVLWALPGQIVLVEMQSLAAPLLACVLAVMLSSARFLPMTMMLMPEMRDPRHRPWKYYVAAQLLSLSGWTMAVARFPELPRAQPRMVFRLHACPRHGERRRHGRRLSRRRPPAAALGLACGTVAYLLFKRT